MADKGDDDCTLTVQAIANDTDLGGWQTRERQGWGRTCDNNSMVARNDGKRTNCEPITVSILLRLQLSIYAIITLEVKVCACVFLYGGCMLEISDVFVAVGGRSCL